MKYISVDDVVNRYGQALESFSHEFYTLEKAKSDANNNWTHLSEYEKTNRKVYALESVNPDEDAEDHYDGDIVYRPDVLVGNLRRITKTHLGKFKTPMTLCFDYVSEENEELTASASVWMDSYINEMSFEENIEAECDAIVDNLEDTNKLYFDESAKEWIKDELKKYWSIYE